MTDFNGGASAPAESPAASAAPVEGVTTPNPVSTEPRPAEPKPAVPEPKKEAPSSRDALRKAREAVNAREGADPKGKPGDQQQTGDKQKPVGSEANRAQDGKFAPKDGTPAEAQAKPQEPAAAKPAEQQQNGQAKPAAAAEPKTETKPAGNEGAPPARFSADAKAEWEKAPPAVRAEVARMEREYDAGFRKYRESAEAFEPVREYHEMAKRGGTDLQTALGKYVNLENLLRADVDAGRIPIRGLEAVCSNFGMSLRQVAEAVLGQTPDQTASQADATIRELRRELAEIKQQVGGVTSRIETEEKSAKLAQIEEFAAKFPRFEELWEDIEFFLKTGKAKDLAEAGQLAERLNPAPAPAQAAEPSAAQPVDLQAQTLKGQKSITGAPSSGSDPVNHQRASSSIRDAIRRAKATAGG